MRKIPTLYVRDPDDMRRVTEEVTPGCEWVLAGEGVVTRKYDGTCTMLDEDGSWWARREVRPGRDAPSYFVEADSDPVTGKRVGWVPVGQSSFAKFHAEALAMAHGVVLLDRSALPGLGEAHPGTYELIGPKINRNPERCDWHVLVQHGYTAAVDGDELLSLDPRDPADWLRAHPDWEGVVWHHPDGRMAKLKGRDFPEKAP